MFPTIFVGHGNPMYAIEENEFTQEWQKLGKTLPKPKAIVVISAHWETIGTYVTAMPNPRTIHDFYGFPPELFNVQYNPPGNPKLAQNISSKVQQTKIQLDESWGLDHGSWSVLKHLYPKADIPVVQLSLDRTKPASFHYELAKELQFLRNEDVLIIGSGNIVHNLRLINFRSKSGNDWAINANETLKNLVLTNNHKNLVNYQILGSEVQLAIPTPEHYLPLIYVLGLQNELEKVRIFNDTVELGSISMASFLMIG
ncbi:MAG TPA: 4,5-DOPA dioxygenase extradiol [Pyrinomonadaceae bacterium]|nr:4,5-DOPA dioxygenase extradiol [Pyrinomonadaceae bacterium]